MVTLKFTNTLCLQPHLAVVNNLCVVGFNFNPLMSSSASSVSFGSALASSSPAATAVTADSSQPSTSTSFSFSKPLQLGGTSAGSFSFADTSGFSFKPPQLSASENKGE